MTWIDEVLEACDESECPKVYLKWAALSCIAATVRRNVWLNKGGMYLLYPCSFVMLVGPSGSRKSFAVNIADKLLTQVPFLYRMTGKITIQAVYDKLSKMSNAQSKEGGGVTVGRAEVCFLGSEFADMFVDDPSVHTSLTNLYDANYRTEWSYSTKKDSDQTLKMPCFNFLAATTAVHLNKRIKNHDEEGGFMARVIQIRADGPEKLNPLTEEDTAQVNYIKLAGYLKDNLAGLQGQFRYTEAGKKMFRDWYHSFMTKEHIQSLNDKTGFAQRANDHVLKTAMCLSLAEGTDMLLHSRHIEEAIIWIQEAVANAKRTSIGGDTSITSSLTRTLMEELINKGKISKPKLLQKYLGEFTLDELDKVINALTAGKILVWSNVAGTIYYELEPAVRDEYNQHVRRVG